MKEGNIYTKKGDDGSTFLMNGQRVLKCDFLIDCIGKIDEVQSQISKCEVTNIKQGNIDILRSISEKLWKIAGEISGRDSWNDFDYLTESEIYDLEKYCDENIPDLSNFVRFKTQSGVELNELRVRIRILERNLSIILTKNQLRQLVFRYINRLSDAVFVMSVVEELREHKVEIFEEGMTKEPLEKHIKSDDKLNKFLAK